MALADVQLRNGNRRRVTIMPGKLVTLPDGLDDLDLREWTNWPKEFRKVQFSVVSDEARQMMELEGEGHTRTEIAGRLGVSKSHVSRTLMRSGKRKLDRKKADSDTVMTWHGPGAGGLRATRGNDTTSGWAN